MTIEKIIVLGLLVIMIGAMLVAAVLLGMVQKGKTAKYCLIVYERTKDKEISFGELGSPEFSEELEKLSPGDITVLHVIPGKNYTECMQEAHQLLGWEAYKPQD
jgi:hypothetical protein